MITTIGVKICSWCGRTFEFTWTYLNRDNYDGRYSVRCPYCDGGNSLSTDFVRELFP